ncbi:MAG: hypothetical protein HY540_04815, partial [Deltaproteobacteria bacterium]|nr:hypothetical protein [Deltaproteobacteria bacterium]
MISGGIKVDVKTVRPISGETSIPKTNLSGATPSAVSGGFERAKAPSHILSGGAGALGVKRFQAKETPAEYAAKVASGAI